MKKWMMSHLQTINRSVIRISFMGLLAICAPSVAAEPEPAQPAVPAVSNSDSNTKNLAERAAAARKSGLPIVHKAVANYPAHRKCFSCHHQTLPMLAILAGGSTPSADDLATITAAAEHTHKSFDGQVELLNKGEGIGGRGLTVSYGLWALKLADWKPDATTAAMVTYLLKIQEDDGHWDVHVSRPPMEDSSETSTALAIAGLLAYATPEQKQSSDSAIAKAKTWLAGCTPKTQEDKASRLWALHLLSATPDELDAAREKVLAAQRPDGGWAQLDDMESDAYATGHTLYVLGLCGMPASDAAYQRGVDYLLKTQREDGSWFVKTRSKPIQVYFDNGDPHGKDQFISTPATCWALAALARGYEQPKPPAAD